MTYAELEKAKAAMVRSWLAEARAMVDERFKDARSHAESGDLLTAADRLRKLVRGLAGTLKSPESGLVGRARASFYRGSFTLQRLRLDPEIHDLDLAPGDDDTLFAQQHHYGGRPFLVGIQEKVDAARSAMNIASASAQTDGTDAEARKAIWDQWQRDHSEAAAKRVERELKTVSIALYEAVGAVMVKPECR